MSTGSFCSAKATHIFPAKNIRILCIESAKTVNEMTLNELVKLTMLWTTGPWLVFIVHMKKFCIFGYPIRVQGIFWSDCTNVQANLYLHWGHISEGKFSDVVAHIMLPTPQQEFALHIPLQTHESAYLYDLIRVYTDYPHNAEVEDLPFFTYWPFRWFKKGSCQFRQKNVHNTG